MHDIKLFGERNTGTHALKELIETNSSSRCAPSTAREVQKDVSRQLSRLKRLERLGIFRQKVQKKKENIIDRVFEDVEAIHCWKHCATLFNSVQSLEGVGVVFLVRHPASWMLSLYKNPYHILPPPGGTLKDFVSHQWQPVGRERLGSRSFNPLELYHRKLASYSTLQEQLGAAGIPYKCINFEELVTDQTAVFLKIRGLLRDPGKILSPVLRSTKASDKTLEDYANYYKHEKWRSELGEAAQPINDQIDWELVGKFGYSPDS
jgi:hypothetical protein